MGEIVINNQKTWEEISATLIKIQAERDALTLKLSAIEKALSPLFEHGSWFISAVEIDSHAADGEQIRSDVLNALGMHPQHHLASHDAEVAKAAFIEGACSFDGDSGLYMDIIESAAEGYAAQLRAKAQQ